VDIPSIATCSLISSLYKTTTQLQDNQALCTSSSSNLIATVSADINKLALRVIKISVSDRTRKARMQSCQESLVSLGSQFSLDKKIAAADKLFESCVEALKLVDLNVLEEVEKSGEAALNCLLELKESEDYSKLFLNIQQFGAKLVKFIEHSVQRYHDSRWVIQKERVLTQADVIRILLPMLIESMREVLRNPRNHSTRTARDIFFEAVKSSISGIISTYKHIGTVEESNNGVFIKKMDAFFDNTEDYNNDTDFHSLEQLIRWIIQHSLAVAKAGTKDDDAEITAACQKILTEFNNLKRLLTEEVKLANHNAKLSFQTLSDIFELLEQRVNGALLRLAISSFSCVSEPLDHLVSSILNSSVPPSARLSDDICEEIKNLDLQTDRIFQLCHFCVFCTSDPEKAQKIRSVGKVLEILETDLVPALLKLYFNPEDQGARSFVRILRKLWKSLLENLSSAVLDIVDPTAYCVILVEEATKIAKQLRSELYNQNKNELQSILGILIGMSETGVDLAWKEIGERSLQDNPSCTMKPLADNHPLVMAERSIWEVRAAAKLVVETIEDLSLHQSLLKRVQVLVSSLGDVVYLMTENDGTKTCETSNILGSLIEPNNEQVFEETKLDLDKTPPPFKRTRSTTTCLSFRAKHNLNKTAAVAQDLRKNLYKITIDLTPFTPNPAALPLRPSVLKNKTVINENKDNFDTPIKRSANGSKIIRRSSARLSSVLNELSALSHELSINLENEDDQDDQINHQLNLEKGKENENKGNSSLRRVALKNVTNRNTSPKVQSCSPNMSKEITKTSFLINSFERLKDIENVENKLLVISHCDIVSDI